MEKKLREYIKVLENALEEYDKITAFFLNGNVGDDNKYLYYYWLGVSEITKQNILNLKQLLGDDDEPI